MTDYPRGGGPMLKTRPDDARGAPKGMGTVVGNYGGMIGNPPHIPTPEMRQRVRDLSAFCSQRTLAAKVGLSKSTLQKYYAEEMEAGLAESVAAIGGKVVQQALKGDLASQFFFLRTRGGWTSKSALEVTGPGGGPVQHAHFDFTSFLAGKTPDELRLLLPLVDQLIAAADGGSIDPGGEDDAQADFDDVDGYGDGGDEG